MQQPQAGAVARGVGAGLIGGAAMAANILVDMKLSGGVANDFRLLGQIGPLRRHWRITGPLIHFGNAAALGALYAVVEPKLKGSGTARGVSFAMVENTGLWPLVLLLDRIHPAIKDGDLSRYNGMLPFALEVVRHVSYGAALGFAYEQLQQRA